MRQRENNKGLTLVELIVTMSIFAIVGIAITTFFIFSINQYQVSTNEVNVQKEAQLTWKQLESMILSTTGGISEHRDASQNNELNLYSIKNSTTKSRIQLYFDKDNHTVLYQEYNFSDVDGTWKKQGDPEIFANYVTQFECVIYDTKDREIDTATNETKVPSRVEVTVSYECDGRTFSSTNVVALRNPIAASSLLSVIYRP